MHYFISDSNTNFARKKGSKDKKKRLIRNIAKGAGALAVTGGLGYLALKNKGKLLPKKAVSRTAKQEANTQKVKQRLELIANESKPVLGAEVSAMKILGKKPNRIKNRSDSYETISRRLDQLNLKQEVKHRVRSLKQDKAYLSASSYFISDF